jgi:hypothetical protein
MARPTTSTLNQKLFGSSASKTANKVAIRNSPAVFVMEWGANEPLIPGDASLPASGRAAATSTVGHRLDHRQAPETHNRPLDNVASGHPTAVERKSISHRWGRWKVSLSQQAEILQPTILSLALLFQQIDIALKNQWFI